MALLDDHDWDSQHELTFSLWLERAECEFLSGNFEQAEQLIMELLKRGASNVEFADASCLKIDLHVLKGELPQAVDGALTCLRLFGIDMPAHPTRDQVQAEYDTVWQTLDGRPIESLIDLPLMTDPEVQAAMEVLSVVTSRRLLYRLPSVVLAGVPHGEGQHAARDDRRFRARLWLLGGCRLGRSFTVTTRVIVSPSSHAIWSRNTALSSTDAKVSLRDGSGRLLDATDRDCDRFHAGDLSHCDRDR